MSETASLHDSLLRTLNGRAWHGPSLRRLVAGLDAAGAAARPVPGAHTIWELVLHLATWQDVVAERLAGVGRRVAEERSWPVPGRGEADWQAAKQTLAASGTRLAGAIAGLAADRLDEPLGRHGHTVATVLHGLLQHDAYHGGQIALLKRASGRRPA
jgi:uncharacterized damage-inducible protein DinB